MQQIFHYTSNEYFSNPLGETDFHLWHSLSTASHDHNYYEVNLITNGKCYHIFNGKKEIVSKGDLFIIPPYQDHRLLKMDRQDFSLVNVSFTCHFMERFVLNFPQFFLDALKRSMHCTTLTPTDSLFLSNLAYETIIPNEAHQAVPIHLWIFSALSFFFLQSLKNPQEKYPAWFGEILNEISSLEYIDKRLNEIPLVQHYSPTTLSKYFKDFLGTTPNNYFVNAKMSYACQLLTKTDYTTSTISEKIGYTSLSHFNRAFKKTFGCTPTEYRKK